jgi:hypothetical protein
MLMKLFIFDWISSKIENKYLSPYILNILTYAFFLITELSILSVALPMFAFCNNLVTTL